MRKLWMLGLMFLLLASFASATVVRVIIGAGGNISDVFVREGSTCGCGTVNYAGSSPLRFTGNDGSGGTGTGYLYIGNVSQAIQSIPAGSTINTVIFSVNVTLSASGNLSLFANSDSYLQTTVTYNNRPGLSRTLYHNTSWNPGTGWKNISLATAWFQNLSDNRATFNNLGIQAGWNNNGGANTEVQIGGTNLNGYQVIYIDYTAPGGVANFTMTASEIYWGNTLTNFSAFFTGFGNFSSNVSTGTLTTNISINISSLVNISVYAVDHDTRLYQDYNLSNGSLAALLNYSFFKLNFSVNDTTDNVPLNGFNLTFNNTLYPNNNGYIIIDRIGKGLTLDYNVTAAGYSNIGGSILFNDFQENVSAQMSWSQWRLNISAYAYLNASFQIQSFSSTATYLSLSSSGSTTTGSAQLLVTPNLTYLVTIDAPGYALANASVFVGAARTYFNFTLNETNSITINISDESTLQKITNTTVTVTFASNVSSYIRNTSVGSIYIAGIEPAIYTLLFNASGYAQRYYTLTVSNRSSQSLQAYLVPSSSSTTTLIIRDFSTGSLLPEALATMYHFINGSWQPVESKLSDITGTASFTYMAATNYRFIVTKSAYQQLVFYLNPITFSSYDIYLTPLSSITSTQDYDMVGIVWSPSVFMNNAQSNFSFVIQSPSGLLTDYGYTLTYPGGNSTSSGSNAIGSQLTSIFNVTGATVLDRVQLDYYYTSTIDGRKNFTTYLGIITNSSNSTLLAQKDNHQGMSFLERIFWATVALLLTVGIPSYFGKPQYGAALGLATLIVFVATGFIEMWLAIIPVLLGVFALSVMGGSR